jgi:DNA-binding transcriptional LysR family regulator
LLEHARVILGNLSRLETELTGYRQGKRGLIRICRQVHDPRSPADELSLFLERPPFVGIDLKEDLSSAIVRALMEKRADIHVFGANIDSQDIELLPNRRDLHHCFRSICLAHRFPGNAGGAADADR